jgi:hypothetical protein
MADSRIVPCNILKWPNIAELLPDQKLIWVHLWFSSEGNSAGCYLYSIGSAAGELSLSVASLKEALRRFQKDGLIDIDKSTGEVMIVDWFRWHSFKGYRQNILDGDIQKIRSERFKILTLEKSSTYIASASRSRSRSKEKPLPPAHARAACEDKSADPLPTVVVGGDLLPQNLPEPAKKQIVVELATLPAEQSMAVAAEFVAHHHKIKDSVGWIRGVCARVRAAGEFQPANTLPVTTGSHRHAGRPWFLSWSGIESKGKELGIEHDGDNSKFSAQVLAAAGVNKATVDAAKRDFP